MKNNTSTNKDNIGRNTIIIIEQREREREPLFQINISTVNNQHSTTQLQLHFLTTNLLQSVPRYCKCE